MEDFQEMESMIQAEIVKALRRMGYFVHSVPNEGAGTNPVRQGQLITMGLYHGVADLIVWLGNGKVAYVEVKDQKGKQTEHQQIFEQKCQKYGIPYTVVRSVDDVLDFISHIEQKNSGSEPLLIKN